MTLANTLLQTRESVGPYHYVPTEWICLAFLVLFSLSTSEPLDALPFYLLANFANRVLHLGQAIRYRVWWLLPTAFFSGILEIVGWSARLWSSFRPRLLLPFEIQYVLLPPSSLQSSLFFFSS
jgi:hypothetical protein